MGAAHTHTHTEVSIFTQSVGTTGGLHSAHASPVKGLGRGRETTVTKWFTRASHEAETKANQTHKQSATRHKGAGGRAKIFSQLTRASDCTARQRIEKFLEWFAWKKHDMPLNKTHDTFKKHVP